MFSRNSGIKLSGFDHSKYRGCSSALSIGIPYRSYRCPGQPPRLAVIGRDSGYPGGPGRATRAYECTPGSRLRFGDYPTEATEPRLFDGDTQEGPASPARCDKALGRRAHKFLEQAHRKLVWCTERADPVIDFWLAFSGVIITVGRLLQQAWTHYRWEGRSRRRP
jgi:hypothetical protein